MSLGKRLSLNLELITAIAKAHDLGHTPFGHAGERTLQVIIERELSTRFDKKTIKKETKKPGYRRSIFHHSLDSARMLIKEKEFENISKEVISGVLTHSWSPWKADNNPTSIPESYESQVVAIADQIASINHDTEDIIEGSPYTEFDKDRFCSEFITGFKNKYTDSYNKLRNDVNSLIVDKSVELGLGRQKRVETFITRIADSSIKCFKDNTVTQKEHAKLFPICLTKEWADLLRWYEFFIRELIQERASWFIARDNMAGALISTVFNHIWPRARSSVTISQMKLPMFEKSEIVKSKLEEKTKYIEHFSDFFNEHYFDEVNNSNFYQNYLNRVKTKGFSVWDTNIRHILAKITPDEDKTLNRLIAVIDFIAGLTDRYCLEMFDEVYQEFVIS
jgi:dGTP triphosphohydrolase